MLVEKIILAFQMVDLAIEVMIQPWIVNIGNNFYTQKIIVTGHFIWTMKNMFFTGLISTGSVVLNSIGPHSSEGGPF
ncbi:hypothetical protein [Oceanobacillus neutriphilus]|uniref:Uncharacterized protein n=1 Tax=Oceanobacillus neutriphilus TaxID=531815 RepID=A0ABQ2NSD1_9BACI|nr:hypothetical protein [Oceanobacillus neutriphilus]GGP09461.1 hypothetical protein GCM10011346_13620 [Oceanobacillus neutriphilus]